MDGLFRNIEQVAFVVSNLDEAVRALTDELGLSPVIMVNFGYMEGDRLFNQNAASIEQVYLDGRYIGSYAVRLGVCEMKNGMQIELIEPLENPSIFRQYLEEHGPGAQHIAVDNSCSFAEMIGRMGAAGNPLGQIARVDAQEDCAFVKHTYSLGTALELHHRGPDWAPPSGQPPMRYADKEKRPFPLADTIVSVCFATKDMERMRGLLEQKYGIGPWEERAEDEAGLKKIVCRKLNTALEIVSPVKPSHPAAKWLEKNGGPGIYYIGLNCPGDFEETLKLLEDGGRSVEYEDETHKAAYADYRGLFGTYLKIIR